MKLAIILVVYIALCAIAIVTLWGPLRRAIDPGRDHRWRPIAITVVFIVLLAIPVLGALVPGDPVGFELQAAGNVILGYIMFFSGVLLIVRVVGFFVVGLPRRRRDGKRWTPTRRTSVATLLAVLILAVVVNVWGTYAAHDVHVTRYEIPKEQLRLDEPLKVALIADLHIGVNSSPEIYADMVDRVNAEQPDIVLVAGDIITSSYDAMGDTSRYSDVISGIEATYGKYAIYGNHDVDEPLLGGFTFVDAEDTSRNAGLPRFMDDCGWTVLEDQIITIPELGNLIIVGRRDLMRPGDGIAEREPLDRLLAQVDPDDAVIMLEHEPDELDSLDRFGVDLVVSGHTHDGQIFPGNIVSRISSPQSYGIKQWGETTAAVTSGVGFYGPPIRVGTISEVVIIEAS